MPDKNRVDLSKYRLQLAKDKNDAAIILYNEGKYLDAVNRAYYSIFSSIRAVLALEAVDFKKHSGIISYFRQKYIKTEIFEKEFSDVIGAAFLMRNQSDYEDFFIVSKEEAKKQCDNALRFYEEVTGYLKKMWNKD